MALDNCLMALGFLVQLAFLVFRELEWHFDSKNFEKFALGKIGKVFRDALLTRSRLVFSEVVIGLETGLK